ncbi:MAG: gamma-glutamyltransferase [Clostridium sp.]|nr:gamma-glutamyltransferase [Clostridium sp.]
MKKNMKKLLALAMTLPLTACGSPSQPESAAPETAAATEAVQTEAAGTEAAEDSGLTPVEQVWSPVDEDGNTKRDDREGSGSNGVVTSANVYASQAGLAVLEQGGNAVDAAIAVSYALGVVEPQASGIGGGGFMLVHTADGEDSFIDYREVAPAAQDAYTWLDENGEVKNNGLANSRGGLAIGVPGEVAGMEYAREHFGSGNVTREQIMQPAIDLAEQGYLVSTYQSQQITDHYADMTGDYPVLGSYYLREDGLPYQNGDVLCNPDLAKTFRLIAEGGTDAFYKGEIADAIIQEIEKYDGVLTKEDLAAYEVNLREPVSSTYRGYKVISCPPPSSGGTHLIQILNILENFDIGSMEVNSAEYAHVFSEAFKAAFADRSAYMADTDFVENVPLQGLASKDYAKTIADRITDESQKWEKGDPAGYEGNSTTSFSVADKDGNIVTVTQTIECSFGSAVAIPGYGFILNDQMHDFSTDPESVNCVEGGKHPLSSMSPTVVLKEDGTPFMTLGSPGATRIFPTVVQVISRVIDSGMSLQEAVTNARIYDNGDDNGICYELGAPGGVSEETLKKLEEMGHTTTAKGEWDMFFGGVQGVMYNEDGTLTGAADPRRDGKALGY